MNEANIDPWPASPIPTEQSSHLQQISDPEDQTEDLI